VRCWLTSPIDQGGCFEDSHPTTHDNPTFAVHDTLFYCVANMPGSVPRTSTYALTNATMPYVLRLADNGWQAAVGRFGPRQVACPRTTARCSTRWRQTSTCPSRPGGRAGLTFNPREPGRRRSAVPGFAIKWGYTAMTIGNHPIPRWRGLPYRRSVH
jgi:hypothetical protein